MSSKLAAVLALSALSASRLSTCRSPGEASGDASQSQADKVVVLKGIDTSELTSRERTDWSRAVSELLAPCADQPVSLEQCVNDARPCAACVPAARYLLEHVRRGKTRAQLDAAYRARFAPGEVRSLEIGDSPSLGAPNAPVVIVEWADFECPACAAVKPVLSKLLEQHPAGVRLVFKHFPLSMHPNAEKAARAAVAAGRQGKFWQMHATLFESQGDLSTESVEKLAQKIGLDLARFRQDRDSEATADAVARDRKQGEKLSLASTPSLFINGRLFPATTDPEQDLTDWVELEFELARRASPKKPAPSGAPAP